MEKKKAYIETYGCQMNVSDTEIVSSILEDSEFDITSTAEEADVVLLNTCSIRENAETRIYGRLGSLQPLKDKNPNLVVGVLGCMATHHRKNLIEKDKSKMIDLVVGPDQYRKLPELVEKELDQDFPEFALNLSKFETYSDIYPTRRDGITGWITITRGCDNFCTYCVVPYTRGRERSRSVEEIVDEAKKLRDEGFPEVYLLGQNVNSYEHNGRDFADLLDAVAKVDGLKRIKYITSHPKDFNEKLVDVIASNANISRFLHLPFQAGNNRILKKMNRRHKIEDYLKKIDYIKKQIPDVGLSTDIIVGYSSETYEEFKDTLMVCEYTKFDSAFVFKYSEREGTKAFKLHPDDVSEEEKVKRLMETDQLVRRLAKDNIKSVIGTEQEILIEGPSKKDPNEWAGKIDRGLQTVVKKGDFKEGDFVKVKVIDNRSFTLVGEELS